MSAEPHVFSGCYPALMTPCNADGTPDFSALVATGESLIAAGMRGVVYCGSMGEWPLLEDDQRREGVEALCRAGVPVMVGTGAQSPLRAVGLAEHAQAAGAAGLMLLPRVLSRGTSATAQEAHFAGLLSAAPDLPSVIYNSPYYGFETRADLFFKLRADHPNLVGFKEFGGAASLAYAAENITSGDAALALLVGVDTQVYHGYANCGAKGAITGIGNALPGPVLRLVELSQRAAAGDPESRQRALELSEALHVLSAFDEGPDLVLHYKALMVLEGHSAYEHALHPADRHTPSQRAHLEGAWRQFKAWWAEWPGATD